jgi:hypothetical protein
MGRFTTPKTQEVLSQTQAVKTEVTLETTEDSFQPLPLDVTYFNYDDIRWGSADHYKEFEEGDIRQFSQLALNNTAVYQSYPTAEITLTDYDNSIRELSALPLEEAIGLLKEDCNMDWPVQTARENYQKHGSFTTYTLPDQEIYEIDDFDVDGDNKDESIIHKNYNCRADGGSTSADIVKGNKIIFSATGDNSTILPADTNNGFYVEQRLSDDTARCCSTGVLRTRFVLKDEKFVPIYEQEVKYMQIKEAIDPQKTDEE